MKLQLFGDPPVPEVVKEAKEAVAEATEAVAEATAANADAESAEARAEQAVAEAAGSPNVTNAQFSDLMQKFEKLQDDYSELAGRVDGWQANGAQTESSATPAAAEPEPLAVAVPAEVVQTTAPASGLTGFLKKLW